ncbi:MAG: biopolymer transporter ExbD [Campylobacterales bacterium]|nr:biopolymer transporter ExbD [Campylobacterales bacterium]
MARALKKVEGMNVIPLIDIVLVLLAIVLTLSTFVANGQIKLDLPHASSSTKVPLKSIDISVDASGAMFWDGQKLTKEEIASKISTVTSQDTVSIRGDVKSAFGDFVFIMDALKKQGVTKISIITKPTKG